MAGGTVANKISSGFQRLRQDKIRFIITIIIFVLIIVGILYFVYVSILNSESYDLTYHESGVDLTTTDNINIPASELPTLSTSEYSLHTWFAIDKSQYNSTSSKDGYSHLISYEGDDSNLALGAWIDKSTNNLFIVYKTNKDASDVIYDPNNNDFNCENTVTLKNFLLNEWNLLSLVVNSNNLMVYLNGSLHDIRISEGTLYYTQSDPPLDIRIANNRDIVGMQKNIRFKNYASDVSEIRDMYFSSPNKFALPDFRNVDYIGSVSAPVIDVGSTEQSFLDAGADLVDRALDGIGYLFSS